MPAHAQHLSALWQRMLSNWARYAALAQQMLE